MLAILLLPPLLSPDLDDPRAQFEVLDRARLTVAAMIGGVGVLFGAYFNWRRVNALERQVTTLQLGQITERFTRAIDQLGSVRAGNEPAPEIRAGGVRSLERIARESVDDYGPILDILTAYLRAQCHWEILDPRGEDFPPGYTALPEEIMNRMDVRFTIDAIVRLWPQRGEPSPAPLNLEYTFLPEIALPRRSLAGANLHGAGLFLAHFEGADLQAANFRGAFLRRVRLRGADLRRADFWGANLHGGQLQGADLRGANLLGADLRWARLDGADLRGADLAVAKLEHADLDGADLRGVNLSSATLENAQVDGSVYDRATSWPRSFVSPSTTE